MQGFWGDEVKEVLVGSLNGQDKMYEPATSIRQLKAVVSR